jgi:hypothetical protein
VQDVAYDTSSELRNRIYDFCIESKTIKEIELFPTFFGPPFEYRHLTQVCKQLRHEFRAVYMAATRVSFSSPGDFIRYSAAFYPTKDVEEMHSYRGDVKFGLGFTNKYRSFHVLPILQLLAAAPGIRCKFNVGPITALVFVEIEKLFKYTAKTSNETWRRILTADATSISISERPGPPTICFRVSKATAVDAEEWWDAEGLPEVNSWHREFRWGSDGTGSRCVKLYRLLDRNDAFF